MRDRLIELIASKVCEDYSPSCDEQVPHSCEKCYANNCRIGEIADHLIANGVIVTPCVAMVEQFIKDGEFDKKRTAHNGKYAVVYVDELKWNCPLIDITEQSYNTEKAEERIQALKGGEAGA